MKDQYFGDTWGKQIRVSSHNAGGFVPKRSKARAQPSNPLSGIPQPKGTKVSLEWIQKLVNERPELIDTPLRSALRLPTDTPIDWVSPLKNDNYAEYRGEVLLKRVGVKPAKKPLSDFWPMRGPQ